MDFKRNIASPMAQGRNQLLAQPLISISKASTPLRTRVISSNNTPNSKKIPMLNGGLNKENSGSNLWNQCTYDTQYIDRCSMKNRKEQSSPMTLNLNPVLTLNKRMQQLKSPGIKVKEECDSSNKFYNTTSQVSNLRTSNSFKSLLQSRDKFAEGFKRKGSSAQLPNMQSVGSRSKLLGSKSTKSIECLLMSPRAESWELKCCNSDGKKAKYRLVLKQKEENEQYYCSKCSITLVQKGFSVEQLSQEEIQSMSLIYQEEDKSFQSSSERNQQKYMTQPSPLRRLDLDTTKITKRINQKIYQLQNILRSKQRQSKEITSSIDEYYNRLFQYLENHRNCDINQVNATSKSKIVFIQQHIQQLQQLSELLFQDKNRQLIKKNAQRQLAKQIDKPSQQFFNNVQCWVQQFVANFQKIHPYFQPTVKSTDVNQAMRFSFEMALNEMQRAKSNEILRMKPLQQEQNEDSDSGEDEQKIEENEKKAFAALFDQQGEDNENDKGVHSPTFKQF